MENMKKIEDWKKIWVDKGNLETEDIKELNGFEGVPMDTKKFAEVISKALDIKKEDKVLEVGCGAGRIAEHLDCDYVGVDYSPSLIRKHAKILGNSVFVSEANNLPFKDNYFDKVFAYSVFHYFPSREYVMQAVDELKRVCKNNGKIFIGDLPPESHRKSHLLFKKDEFGGEISEGFYNKKRFNVLFSCIKK